MKHSKIKFELGQTVITPNAQQSLHPEDVIMSLSRHVQGDWGEASEGDKQENEFSLSNGLRLMSVYQDRAGTKFWIITEADRSSTTVLLPEDY